MGRVWRGFDPDLEVPVAIKELKEQFRDANNLERFYREAQIAAKCRHQNIVLITDLSKDPPYLVMEFLEAQELSIYIQKGKPLPLDRMVNILGQVCDGLGFLHKRGIFHRDLKPANIMLLSDDTVKITDFGISKAPFGQKTMTQVIMGTIPYMAPEQITTPSGIDSRVDIWALGVILFEITQRKHPFPGEGDINTIFHIVHSEPAALGQMPPEIAGPLGECLAHALRKSPDERIPGTKEFKAMLRGLLKQTEDPASIVFPWQPPTDSTMVITAGDVPAAVDPKLLDRARSLIHEIEALPEAIRSVIEGPAWEKAVERARMSRRVLEEGNAGGIESAIRGLESQREAIQEAIQAGFDRLIAEAETALGKGREAEAAALYRRVAAGDPSRAEAIDGVERASQALITRGRRLRSQGNLPGAMDAWRQILGWEPAHPEALRLIEEVEGEKAAAEAESRGLEAARGALDAGRPEEVAAALRPVLDRKADHAEARRLEAEALRAIEEATRTLHADALREEGRRFLKARDLARARISFTTLVEIVPRDPEAIEALAAIERGIEEQRRLDEAKRTVAEAEAALQVADFRRAVGLFESALERVPDDREIRKRMQTAQRRLDALLNAESEAGQREKAGEIGSAIQVWEQVLKLQPSHARAGGEISRLRAETARQEDAIRKEEAARRAVVQRAYAEHASAVEAYRAIPTQDHALIGAAWVARASEAAAQMEKAREKSDEVAVRDGAEALRQALSRIEARRKELLAKKAAEIEEAARAVERALEGGTAGLSESVVRSAREALAKARREAGGPALHPLEAHPGALKRAAESIQREIQAALKGAREQVRTAKEALEAAAAKNRRAVAGRPDLAKKIDALLKQAGSAGASVSIGDLGKLAGGLEAARAQVPTDPMRFLPHALAIGGAIAAAGAFLVWQYIQAHTEHELLLRVAPWGSIVSMVSEGGAQAQAPPGESPFHEIRLLPGRWTITVENGVTGVRGVVTVSVPGDAEGRVQLEGPDYREGVRRLVEGDPFFEEGP